jgi:LPS O-antigen subunit length determinant protein (WzzB/FepE family)
VDEPFISGFRDLQERRAFLEGVYIDTDALSAVTIDAAAKAPHRAVWPRKLLLIFVAATLGFITGIFLASIAEFRSKIDDEHEKASA